MNLIGGIKLEYTIDLIKKNNQLTRNIRYSTGLIIIFPFIVAIILILFMINFRPTNFNFQVTTMLISVLIWTFAAYIIFIFSEKKIKKLCDHTLDILNVIINNTIRKAGYLLDIKIEMNGSENYKKRFLNSNQALLKNSFDVTVLSESIKINFKSQFDKANYKNGWKNVEIISDNKIYVINVNAMSLNLSQIFDLKSTAMLNKVIEQFRDDLSKIFLKLNQKDGK